MDSEKRRKRKHLGRPYNCLYYLSFRSFFLFLTFLFLVFLFSHQFPFNPASFRPVLGAHFLYSSSASNSLLDSLTSKRHSWSSSFSPAAKVVDRVLFPDHLLLFTPDPIARPENLDCFYSYYLYNDLNGSEPQLGFAVRPVLSSDRYDQFRSVVRCPLPPGNFSGVELRRRGDSPSAVSPGNPTAVSSWERLVYEAEIDGDTAVVFVKGLNLRPHRKSDPSRFRCRFGLKNPSGTGSEGLFLSTPAIAAAQEVVRCALPKSIQMNPEKARGIRVTVSTHSTGNAKSRPSRVTLPSVARIYGSGSGSDEQSFKSRKKHELCACTMVWNQASALKEWITYHSWLGVERWFVYDNNSDDEIEEVVRDLDDRGYNVTRRLWPWIKTQEAGFSHCASRVRERCKWVGFFDVDEYFYLPGGGSRSTGQRNGLADLVANFSASETIGEIRTTCHSFGPSGLSSAPEKGVTVGYTCRLKRPERHKSIVRPDLIDTTLLNAVHHFRLREGYRYLNVPENTALVNHYKYQVWERFQAKFFRRVATYVVDWQEDQNQGSKDRAPGLGTEAIEPPNWKSQFCEVWDNRLRDFVLAYFADPVTGSLPWEERSNSQAQL